MAIPLKQSTAATLVIGQFVDFFDAYTPETGLAAGTVDEIGVWKAGATGITDISGTTTFTHRANGEYTITLSTDDTDTLGPLWVMVKDADVCLGVRLECTVYPANVYDSLFAGSDYLQTDAQQIEGVDATNTLDARVQAVLETNKLDHLAAVADADDVADNSILAKMAASDGDWSGYSAATDSLEAVRDHIGDGTNLTEAGGTGDQLTAINLPDQTMNITGDITGNLSGSVGSVTGAVGSVTGAVGSVTGAVGSVTAQVTADVTAISGDAVAADNLEMDYDGNGYNKALSIIGTCTTNTDMRGTDGANTTTPPTAIAIRTEMDNSSTKLANLDATVSSRSSHSAADVWTSTTRTLSAISSTLRNQIADNVLRRSLATAEASADGDALSFRSLIGAIAKLVNKVSISGATLTVTKADDTTTLGTQTVTTSASADPITGTDTN